MGALGWYLGELAENAQSAQAPALAEVRTGNRFQALAAEDDDGPAPPPPTAEHRGRASACVSFSEVWVRDGGFEATSEASERGAGHIR